MAFTGTPVVVKVTNNKYRITGVSLIGGAEGTIGMVGKTVPSGISLPCVDWGDYELDGVVVGLQDSIEVNVNLVGPGVGDIPVIAVSKDGTDRSDFEITIGNTTGGEGDASGPLEIYVERTGR